MDPYPKEFSSAARARVAAAKLRAQQAFRRDATIATLSSNLLGDPLRERVTAYIMTVVLAFGREACELGRPTVLLHLSVYPPWSVERIQTETLGFLDKFALDSVREKGGDEIQGTIGGVHISPQLRDALLNTAEWERFETLCLEIAELQASPPLTPLFGAYRSGSSGESPIAPPPVEVPTAPLEQSAVKKRAPSSAKATRMTCMIYSPVAVDKMTAFIEKNYFGSLPDFAHYAGPGERTLREFRRTKRLRRDILKQVADAMNVSLEDLIKQ